MRVLYMGTPEFAVPPLQALLEHGFEVCGVITQPDRPRGRGMRLHPTPVKEFALTHSMPVFQPAALKNSALLPLLKELSPDIIVVAAYGRILPKYILSFPRYGCINIHCSLLPKYRGAAPIQRALMAGEEKLGVCIMQMDEGLDTGDILLSRECAVLPEDTSVSMFEKLSSLGAGLLIEALLKLGEGGLRRIPQEHGEATYAPPIKKAECFIDWSKSAFEIVNLIRGVCCGPVAFTESPLGRLKILRAAVGGACSDPPGSVLELREEGLPVAAGDGRKVIIKTLQPCGGRPMSAHDFVRGRRAIIGAVLSSPKGEKKCRTTME